MKITHFELYHISVPFAQPFKLSKVLGTVHEAHAVILKMYTDGNIIGLGEADPIPPFTEETIASIIGVIKDYLAPLLINQDPCSISILEDRMDRSMYGNNMAKGAVSMALHDILGKTKGVPAYTLLGGRFVNQIPLAWSISSGTPDEDIVAIESKMKEGYRTFMIKMGSLPIEHEIKRIKVLTGRFGSEINIIADPNQGWDVSQTLEFISCLKDYRIGLLEQPISRSDLNGLKRIRAHSLWPISADESVVSLHDAVSLIQEQAVDVFSIKISKNGGLSKAKKIAVLAEAFGLKCLMNSMLEFGITQAASLQVGCTLSNLIDMGHFYFSPLRLADDVTDYVDHIHQGFVKVPDTPGLGIALNESKLRKYTRDYVRIEGEN